MKNSVFVLFYCDAWHSHSSKRICGVYDDFDNAFDAAKIVAKKSEEGKIKKYDKELLKSINQTQNRSENYIIEELEINKLINQI